MTNCLLMNPKLNYDSGKPKPLQRCAILAGAYILWGTTHLFNFNLSKVNLNPH